MRSFSQWTKQDIEEEFGLRPVRDSATFQAWLTDIQNVSEDEADRLQWLAELSGIVFEAERIDFLSEMNPCNIEGRYPELWGTLPSPQEAQRLLKKTEELLKWLKNQLNSQ